MIHFQTTMSLTFKITTAGLHSHWRANTDHIVLIHFMSLFTLIWHSRHFCASWNTNLYPIKEEWAGLRKKFSSRVCSELFYTVNYEQNVLKEQQGTSGMHTNDRITNRLNLISYRINEINQSIELKQQWLSWSIFTQETNTKEGMS